MPSLRSRAVETVLPQVLQVCRNNPHHPTVIMWRRFFEDVFLVSSYRSVLRSGDREALERAQIQCAELSLRRGMC